MGDMWIRDVEITSLIAIVISRIMIPKFEMNLLK